MASEAQKLGVTLVLRAGGRAAASAALAALFAASGCASLGTATGAGLAAAPQRSEPEALLARGDEALGSRNFVEAQQLFESVKTKFPFHDAAKTAELRLADTDFEREQFVEARERYQSFVRLHPSHPKVDYAAFRAALTHFRDVPSDFFLLPSGAEKDQVELKNALTAMSDFLRASPDSPLRAEAEGVVRDVRRRLASHELYVARFYAKRERWPAVVERTRTLLRAYPRVGFDDEALALLDAARTKLVDPAPVREVLSAYLEAQRESPEAGRARRILEATALPVVPSAAVPPSTPSAPPPPAATAPEGAGDAPPPAGAPAGEPPAGAPSAEPPAAR